MLASGAHRKGGKPKARAQRPQQQQQRQQPKKKAARPRRMQVAAQLDARMNRINCAFSTVYTPLRGKLSFVVDTATASAGDRIVGIFGEYHGPSSSTDITNKVGLWGYGGLDPDVAGVEAKDNLLAGYLGNSNTARLHALTIVISCPVFATAIPSGRFYVFRLAGKYDAGDKSNFNEIGDDLIATRREMVACTALEAATRPCVIHCTPLDIMQWSSYASTAATTTRSDKMTDTHGAIGFVFYGTGATNAVQYSVDIYTQWRVQAGSGSGILANLETMHSATPMGTLQQLFEHATADNMAGRMRQPQTLVTAAVGATGAIVGQRVRQAYNGGRNRARYLP